MTRVDTHNVRYWPKADMPKNAISGPYAFVRHPGYTAGILIIVASGPALGSWLAAGFVVIFSLPFLLHRAITEDRILQAELAGYSDYAARVRWRLLPGIW
jgi:protein-S-isoprenylcysteine O-methyltransferase Ste14